MLKASMWAVDSSRPRGPNPDDIGSANEAQPMAAGRRSRIHSTPAPACFAVAPGCNRCVWTAAPVAPGCNRCAPDPEV